MALGDPSDIQGRNLEGANVYEPQEKERTAEVVFGGSTAEAVVGAAAVVLAILGLASIHPGYMASIGTIAVGAALLFQGGAVAARYTQLAARVGASEVGSGVTAEILGGAARVALGVLALLGIYPGILTPVAIIIFGGALLIGSNTTARLNALSSWRMSERARTVTREAVEMASGTEVLIGIAAVILGILALLGMNPRTLVLISLLALGATVLFSGSAVSSRMAAIFRR
jgi:hypothetical protein